MLRNAGLALVVLSAVSAAFACAPGALRAGPEPTPTSAVVATSTALPAPRTPVPAAPRTPLPIAATTLPTLAPIATATPLDPPELRAVWVDAFHDGFKTPQQVERLVAWARAANLNALFVQVRRRGDAYYLYSIEPLAEDPDLAPGFDALQYLIKLAHQGPQPLQVHAWLATLPIWYQRDTPPQALNHAFNVHGPTAEPADSWLMSRDDGEIWAGVGAQGIYYVDPGNPAVVRYTTDVVLNLLRHYDVDGIHLDQVRYYEGQPLRWGYNPTSVARFNLTFGRDPETQPEPSDPDWIAWRREQVTNLVRRIYLEARALRPGIAITAAVVTWGTGPRGPDGWEKQAPYASVLQDWRAWLQEGIVDYLLPMDYYRESGDQADWFDTWTRWQTSNSGKRAVALGLGSYLNQAADVVAQLTRARALGSLGIALYSYAVPTRDLEDASQEDRAAFAAELRSIFARPAAVPELAWLSRPMAGGVLVDIPGRADVSVVLSDDLAQRRSWRTDASGFAGAVDLPLGRYVVTVSGPGLDPTPIEIQVVAGRTTAVRFAPGRLSGSS
jgi:uncharacterized lipoprotein YddW (UPF0748 family)